MNLLLLVSLILAAEPGAPSQTLAPAAAPVLTLEQVLRQAQEKNLDLKQASARLKQAQEASSKVLANYLPQVSVSGSYTHNQVGAEFTLPNSLFAPGAPGNSTVVIQKQEQLAGQAQLSQALLVPALWPAFGIASLSEKVAAMSTENARREILFSVASLYYGAVSLKETIAVQEQLLRNNLEHERDAKVRVEAGAMPKITLIRAQIDRARAEQDLVRAQRAYASAKVALGTMFDREADYEVARPEEPQLPADLTGLEAVALKERPDVMAADLSRELAEKNKKSVYYQYLPSILGRAVYQAQNLKGFTGTFGQYALSIVASWTLWDGGLRESQLRENTAKLIEAEAALRKAQISARDEVRRALLDLESSRANRIKSEEQARLARENMRLITVNYQAGAATQIEVSDANTALAQAELGFVAESLNAELAALRLLRAAGEFNPKP